MTTYINTPAGSGTDNTKCTISFWLKQTHNQGSESPYLFSGGDGASNNFWIRLQSDARLYIRNRTSGSNDCQLTTKGLLRDFGAWYHIVFELDSTQSTAADRAKIWINGVRNTQFDTDVYMTQNNLWHCYGSTVSHIGKRVNDGSSGTLGQFNMSHFHYIDGTAYDASYFGSTDSTTGEWKINTAPSVTYGTRGFFILKDGNSVTDQSPNTNNCTVAGGTLTKTEDNPSNVFATWNPLAHNNSAYSLSKGNLTYSNADSDWSHGGLISTIGIPALGGKYYWEHKKTYAGNHIIFGLISEDQVHRLYRDAGTDIYERINGVQLSNSSGSGIYLQEATDSGSIGAVANGSILMCAYDADNRKLWYGIDGTWHNSGDPANGTNETIGSSEFTAGKIYFPFSQSHNSSGTASSDTNFGNGYFGTTAVSSAGTNASGNGIFEYDVPTGFTALSTKGLNL